MPAPAKSGLTPLEHLKQRVLRLARLDAALPDFDVAKIGGVIGDNACCAQGVYMVLGT